MMSANENKDDKLYAACLPPACLLFLARKEKVLENGLGNRWYLLLPSCCQSLFSLGSHLLRGQVRHFDVYAATSGAPVSAGASASQR
eukprot:scaffold41707_cov15-Tisochrysis_lutea.AAC.1